ncbi:aminodeoxychorismate/anthranilate synthase component II [Brevibacterium sp. HMSC063G07]|uniref:anthranilate synthase component II n=1 Tax=Brevibacterium sp. HMSC063G07 TaxID=1739261 RepID=UPI0008A46CA8|nr:gamma-glutamyl-gamma-aminobutyrate hydrolase family protein [Brevibacterium sp. HMSC063G07]OFL67644.1 glutamine amidotransferase [Brevibacterium sp. HMSC063G07]
MTARILVIDNYDSFVYTLVSYVQELGAQTDVIRNDDVSAEQLDELLPQYDGVLVSPGPGAPAEAGISADIVRWAAEHSLPYFGVCLGHQVLGEVFGAVVDRSPVLMHGKTSQVVHSGESVFAGCPSPLTATRYHSLAIVDDSLPLDVFEITAQTEDGIIMGIRHRKAPLHGVQFHPESVLTQSGYPMVANFLAACGMREAIAAAHDRAPVASAAALSSLNAQDG